MLKLLYKCTCCGEDNSFIWWGRGGKVRCDLSSSTQSSWVCWMLLWKTKQKPLKLVIRSGLKDLYFQCFSRKSIECRGECQCTFICKWKYFSYHSYWGWIRQCCKGGSNSVRLELSDFNCVVRFKTTVNFTVTSNQLNYSRQGTCQQIVWTILRKWKPASKLSVTKPKLLRLMVFHPDITVLVDWA